MKTKKILIVGGNGNIGKYLAHYLNSKYHLYILDKKFKKTPNSKIKNFIKHNLLSRKKIKTKKNFDVVIFLVGLTGGPKSIFIKNLKLYIKYNCETLLNFLDQKNRVKFKKIIFASTEQVYGDDPKFINQIKLIEPSPKNYYGLSKLLSEKILYNYYSKKFISVDVLRFPRVIFKNNNNLISKMILSAKNSNKIQLHDTTTKFNFLYIEDFVKAILSCMGKTNTGYSVYNIFNESSPLNLVEIAKFIKKKLHKVRIIKRQKKPLKQHNPVNLKFNTSLTKRKIKWKPSHSNLDIIKMLIKFHEIKEHY